MAQKNQIIKDLEKNQEKTQKFKAFSIYADMSKVDHRWEKYGYLTAPLAIKKDSGIFSDRSHKNQVLIYNDDFRKVLSNSYAVVPHQFVSETLDQHVIKNLDDLKMYVDKEYNAHDMDSHYWTLLSNEKFSIEGHDNVQVGVTIRNGIGTNVSLGVDLYTMRLICTNGAVARGKNMGAFSIAHVGKVESIALLFEKSIRFAFERVKELIEYYRKSTKIKVNDQIATQIYKKMPFGSFYLPTTWNIISRYGIKDLKAAGRLKEDTDLVNVKESQTLWEAFNQITERQKDGLRTGRINFAAVSTHQVGLHNAMIEIVNQNSRARRV